MRRVVPLLVVVTLLLPLACDAPPSAGPVAQVQGWELTPARLADLLVLGQPLPLDSATATGIAREWVARAALAHFELEGGDPLGPDATEASLWLERREALLDAAVRLRDGASPLEPEDVRAVFEADSVALFAHVLRRVDRSTSQEERALQRRTAQEILNALRSGGSWADAVSRSEDAATRDASGLLGVLRPDELPPALQRVGAQLQPGQVSAVVEGPDGFHVLYRPRFSAVAELFADRLRERRLAAVDERATLEALQRLDLEVPDPALARTRALAGAVALPGDPDEILLAWDGGALTTGVLARYLATLPPASKAAIDSGSDDEVAVFLAQLAAREARLRDARARGVEPDAARTAELEALHREEVARWQSAVPTDGGTEQARQALSRYMERLVSRQATVPGLPPVLEAWLLGRVEWSLHLDAVPSAVDRARELLSSAAGTEPGA